MSYMRWWYFFVNYLFRGDILASALCQPCHLLHWLSDVLAVISVRNNKETKTHYSSCFVKLWINWTQKQKLADSATYLSFSILTFQGTSFRRSSGLLILPVSTSRLSLHMLSMLSVDDLNIVSGVMDAFFISRTSLQSVLSLSAYSFQFVKTYTHNNCNCYITELYSKTMKIRWIKLQKELFFKSHTTLQRRTHARLNGGSHTSYACRFHARRRKSQ